MSMNQACIIPFNFSCAYENDSPAYKDTLRDYFKLVHENSSQEVDSLRTFVSDIK